MEISAYILHALQMIFVTLNFKFLIFLDIINSY